VVKIGTKRNSQKQQKANVELEGIIEEFGRAMRDANKEYVAIPPTCSHVGVRFTPGMAFAWERYVAWCAANPNG